MAELQSNFKQYTEKNLGSTDHLEPALTRDGDKQYFENSNDGASEPDWSQDEERQVVWKIDWHVFPMLSTVFGLSLLDRTNISAAFIAGMDDDLKLIGNRYNIALLVFFIGYFTFELPSNYVIRRIGARWWLPSLICCWRVCVMSMGFVQNWHMLTLCRALIGTFEAGLLPGAIFIISSWYTQYETARRVALFWGACLIATAFGPILAYLLSLIRVGDDKYTQGWRWIFIVESLGTAVAGLISPLFLVDFPERARFLSKRQMDIAIRRVRIDKANQDVVHLNTKETLSALLDWKLGLYCINYFIAASSVYSVIFFTPVILRHGMGFSYEKAQLLCSPPHVFTIFACFGMAWISDKTKLRWPILNFQSLTAATGLLIVLYAKAAGVRYFGLFLACFGTQANIPGTLTYGQNQTSRMEKRGIIAAAMISVGALGGICGSTIFRKQDEPLYMPGMWATIGMQFVHLAITFSLSMYFKRQNRLADEGVIPILEGVPGYRYAP